MDAEAKAALLALPDWALAGWAWDDHRAEAETWPFGADDLRVFLDHADCWRTGVLSVQDRTMVARLRAALGAA